MEHPSKLEENLNALLTKLTHLNYPRDEPKIRGDPQINRWLNDLEDSEHEVNEIQKRLHELKSGYHPNKFNIRLNLNKKVIKILKELELLEQERYKDLKSTQKFIIEQKKGMPQQFSCEQLIGFTSNDRIGYGGFADVYKSDINGVLVAIKVLRDRAGHVMQRQFMAEVSMMFMTSHRNLVKLHGYCYEPRFRALVYEYMENGSLDKILYNNRPSIQWEKLYDIAIQVAKGLSYLHESCNMPIIHHDVKAANVLLDSKFSPKITDFGLAKIYKTDENHATQSQIGGTRIYAAPEVLLGSPIVTYHCDIFSFGMMLFEVLQRKIIGEREDFPWQVWQNFEKGQLEKIILGCGIEEKNKDKAYTLSIAALWCIQFKPFDRPSMSTVINVLEGILQLPPPPNPFPHKVSSIRSNTSGVSTRTGGPPHPLALSGVSPLSDEWLGEKQSNLEIENQVLHQKALAISQTAKDLSIKTINLSQTAPENGHTQSGETRVPLGTTPTLSSFQEPEIDEKPQKSLDEVLDQKALAISQTAKALSRKPIILSQRTPENGHTQSGETRVSLDMTPTLSSFQEPEIEERPQKLLNEEQQENHDLLIKCISQDLGFSIGRPVAASLIYKCLHHWSSFEVEITSIFDRIIRTIGSFIEVQDNNDTLSYWLSNSSTLALLLHWTIKAPDAGEAWLSRERWRISSASLYRKMSQGFQGRTSEALVFKCQLTTLFEKTYGMIRDNLEKEISPMLRLCIEKADASLLRCSHSVKSTDAQQAFKAQMQSVVKILNNYLRTLTANFVPPSLIGMVFAETFSFITTLLSNTNFHHDNSNNEFMKLVSNELEQWCVSATNEFASLPQSMVRNILNGYMKKGYHGYSYSQVVPKGGARHSVVVFSVNSFLESVLQIDIVDDDPPPLLRQSPGFAFLLN